MGTSRKNPTGKGQHSYWLVSDQVEARLMGDGRWYIFNDGRDTGKDFGSLAAVRRWWDSNSKD